MEHTYLTTKFALTKLRPTCTMILAGVFATLCIVYLPYSLSLSLFLSLSLLASSPDPFPAFQCFTLKSGRAWYTSAHEVEQW